MIKDKVKNQRIGTKAKKDCLKTTNFCLLLIFDNYKLHMARITVEDCIDKFPSRFELVLIASNRARKLHSGESTTLEKDNDKNTVIALREIAEENIQVQDLTESAIYKLRKHIEQVDDGSEEDEEIGDEFESLYKGEISKSGAPILPSKRARKSPEKIQVSKEDLAELSQTAKPDVDPKSSESTEVEHEDVSLEEVSESENQESEAVSDDTEASNS